MPYIIKYNYTHTHTHIYIYCELGSTLAAPPGNPIPSSPHTALSLTAQHGNLRVFQAAKGQERKLACKAVHTGFNGWPQQRNYGLATVLGSRTLSHCPPSPGCLSQKVAIEMYMISLGGRH